MHTVRLLAAAGTIVLLAWSLWYVATRPGRPDRQERRRARSMRAHARDLATGPAQLVDELDAVPAFDAELPDDAEPVDMTLLMREQDIEIGVEFVAEVEAMLAAELAPAFGFVYLEGAAR